jgi:hypothetical protein
MKLAITISAIIILSLFGGVGSTVQASGECEHHAATIQSLSECVEHALMMGHISNAGVANSLFAKLSAAQAAVDRGQPAAAANILNAFILEVRAQSGQFIDAEHAEHMAMHAGEVITALTP